MFSDHAYSRAILNRRNLINTIPTVDPNATISIGPKGLYNVKANQAININAQSRWHDIQPQTTPSTFNSSNFMDFKIPQSIHVLDKISLYLSMANGHATNTWVSDQSSEFFIRRVEVRQAGEVLQTLESLDLYLRHTVFKNYEELQHQEARNGIDVATYQADATIMTIAAVSTNEYSVDLETLLDQTQIFIAGLRHEITIRVYLENSANFSDDAENANLTLSSAKIRLREKFYSPPDANNLSNKYAGDLDLRFCDALIETRTETLTGGTNNKLVLQNFDGEMSPVTFVVLRDMSDIDQNSSTFVGCANIHFEDQSGHNLNNGIVWKDVDIRNYVYPMYFPNNMSQASGGNLNVYPFVNALDPHASVTKGVNSGYDVLQRHSRLVLNPTSTLTSHQVDVVAYVHRHARVSGGVIKIY
jgi:hypothetical protein